MKRRIGTGFYLFLTITLLSILIPVAVMAENTTIDNEALIKTEDQIVNIDQENIENEINLLDNNGSIEASITEIAVEVTLSTTNNLSGAVNKKMIDMNITDYKDITSLKINAGTGVPIGNKDGDFMKEKLINLKKIDMTGVMEVTLPNYLFYRCVKLEELLLPYGAKVSDSMCYGCTSLRAIDLEHVNSTIESNAFASCSSLEKVILPQNAILKFRAFTECRLLDDINWEAIKSTYDEGFNECAFDFTQGYPLEAWNDSNVININDHQIPKLYFSLAQTDYQINAGDSFILPTPLFKTKNGTNYSDLEKYKVPYSAWLDQNTNYAQKMAYSTTIKLNGKVVNSLDTSMPGNYEITYNLLNTTTYADKYTLICNVTVNPGFSVSSFTTDKTSGQYINTNINLSATASDGLSPYQYKFYYQLGNSTVVLKDFSSVNTAVFIPTAAGTYILSVDVTDKNGEICTKSITEYVIKKEGVKDINASYQTHVQNVGWQGWKSDGEMSGTSGQGLRLEGIEIKLDNQGYDVGVSYSTHIENIGWQDPKSNGVMSGTSGQGLRLEAIKINLTGSDANNFDIYYQVHAQNYGWLDWAKNGAESGTQGLGLRLEGINIVILPKESPAPGATATPYISEAVFLNNIQGEWYDNKNLSSLPTLKIREPNVEAGLLWCGSKWYEYRYRIVSISRDGKSGTIEAYKWNYYQPISSGSGNTGFQKIEKDVNPPDQYIYDYNKNTITEYKKAGSSIRVTTFIRK